MVPLATVATIILSQAYRPSTPVEIYIAPIVAPSNIIGMGGAAQALATGSGAILQNPAAMAVRYDYNGNKHFDWDFSFDYLISAGHNDVENSGRGGDGEKLTVIAGSLGFNFGKFGIGVGVDAQNMRSCGPGITTCPNASVKAPTTALQIDTTLLAVAASYAFLDGEVTAGISAIVPLASFQTQGNTNTPTYNGDAIAGGIVVRPFGHQMRFGATARMRTDASRSGAGNNQQVGELFLPDRLEAPWQVAVGGAYSFGEKPLNLRNSFGKDGIVGESIDPEKRAYLVVATDVVAIGPGGGATGRRAYLDSQEQTAGPRTNISVRVGAESEFWEDVMRVRAGGYWEPSRFDASNGRLHGTAGLDIRLFELIWVWRLTGAVDLARDYHNLGVSIGFWH